MKFSENQLFELNHGLNNGLIMDQILDQISDQMLVKSWKNNLNKCPATQLFGSKVDPIINRNKST